MPPPSRSCLCTPALVALAAWMLVCPGPAAGAPRADAASWRTPAERSGYRTTPTYDETMDYCRRLAAASPWVRLDFYGESGQGRPLPLLVLAREGEFTPDAARASGKPIVLVQNGIHSGEIEGKDACLELIRDIAVLGTRAALADGVVLLVLPIFSVDAHERSGPYHRINQNGPEKMGWRTTPIGVNLNRDYVKAEAPETRAMLSQVFTRWWPHLLVDTHTTDGADYQYDLTWSASGGLPCPPALERWVERAFAGRALPRLESMGHLTAPYLSFRSNDDPMSGIESGWMPPRFSTAYPTLHGRAGILVETHMLKPYRTRVRATYDLLVALLEELNAHPGELLGAVGEAERQVIGEAHAAIAAAVRVKERDLGTASDPRPRLTLRSKLTDRAVPFAYRGRRMRWERSAISGGTVPRYLAAPLDTVVDWYRDQADSVTTPLPAGYWVPREWTAVRERLDLHGVRYRRLRAPWRGRVEIQRIVTWHAESRLREGHYPTVVDSVALEWRERSFRAGDLWVPLDQPSGRAAVHLLEARAPDGLMYWNAFDTVLERKEYAEPYVIEPIARRMMRAQPALADSFRARLARDPAFAADSTARLNWFYLRSRWADPELNVHPVARALGVPPESLLEP